MAPPYWSLRVASSDDVMRLLVYACSGTLAAIFVGATGELQKRLEVERGRLAITLKSIGDAVIATDAEGRVTFLNPTAEIATGWRLEEAAGLELESIFKIVNENTRAAVESPIRKVLARGKGVGLANHTLLIRRDGTEIPIDDSAAPILDPSGNIVGCVLVFRDITEAKQNQLALMHAEKLATVGKLASTIAHEINNPLEAVSNLLFLVGEDATLSQISKERIEQAQSELARAAEISKQTLSFHKVDSVRTSVKLRQLVDSVLRLYSSRAAGRGVQMKNEIGPNVLIHAIASQMRQLVSNLISNALDAMQEGGMLRITVESKAVDGTGEVRIVFSDTGHGIDPANLNRVFEPFFTTKKDVGTGLGLWVAKRIVEDHDGELLVESRTSGVTGTTFTVVLSDNSGQSCPETILKLRS
jgi:PAS domain S-box-containing protein